MQPSGRWVLRARYYDAVRDQRCPAVAAVMLAMLSGCSGDRGKPPQSGGSVERPATPVRITQFYANPPAVPRGGKALLCYGVEGATAVRIEPPVEQLSPALTRCFEVTPDRNTEYKLIATNAAGDTAEASVSIRLGSAGPVLFDLAVNKTRAKPGELISLCFQSRNATSVRGGPGRFQFGGRAAKDCLIDQPSKTTTYRVEASNAAGLTDSASITVEVRP